MNQAVLDRAVQIATRAAMNGHPVARIVWMPPETAAQDPLGAFVVTPYYQRSSADTPPWDR